MSCKHFIQLFLSLTTCYFFSKLITTVYHATGTN